MPFIPSGKRAKQAKQKVQREARDEIIDRALGAVRLVVYGPRVCLQSCFLAKRILDRVLPGHGFTLRLGSLHVLPLDQTIAPIAFDPRGPEGVDGGFHAWLEHTSGELIDPSICPTLTHDGYDVGGDDGYIASRAKDVVFCNLRLIYEELPDLELFGADESEPHLARMMEVAMSGIPQQTSGTIYLDLRWRPGHGPRG